MTENTSEKATAEVAAAQKAGESAELARREAASRRPGQGEPVAVPATTTEKGSNQ